MYILRILVINLDNLYVGAFLQLIIGLTVCIY